MAGHRFKAEKANLLLEKKRYSVLPPKMVLEKLGVAKADIVADLGAGNGFFTLPIAELTEATTYAVDIQPEMLQMLEDRAKEQGITNIKTIVSDLDQIKLEEQSVDKVIISFVIHEVPNLKLTLSEIKRILKPDGAVMIIEWEAKETESGPPLHERIPSEQLAETVRGEGFEADIISLNEANYGLILKHK